MSDSAIPPSIGGGGGAGTVTDFSAGDLSPLFTTTEATTTSTPALSFVLRTDTAANTVYGNATASAGSATFSSSPRFTAIGNLTGNGFVKTSGGTGTLSIDTATYLTANQNISLTGDVTGGPAATSIAATIANNIVTYAKMQDVSATSRFLGRITAAAGDVEELTAANAKTILALTSTDVGLGSVTNAAQTLASVVPNTAPTSGQILVGNAGGTAYAKQTVSGSGATITLNDTGVFTIGSIAPASISAAAGIATWLSTPSSSNLRIAMTDENGTGALLFSGAASPDFTTGITIGGAAASRKMLVGDGTKFAASAETWAVPGASANNVLKSDGTNWTAAQLGFSNLGGTLAFSQTSMNTNKLLGRNTAAVGVIEEITLGTNLSMTGTTLNAAGGAGGTPGGADTQVQFNDATAFGGDTAFTWNKTTDKLSLGVAAGSAGWVTSPSTELVLEQTGDSLGTTRLRIRSRAGMTGAQFENASLDLVDFGFVGSASPINVFRMEHRGSAVYDATANPNGEFELATDTTGTPKFSHVFGQSMSAICGVLMLGGAAPTSAVAIAKDIGITRNSAGILEINNGTAGTYRDLYARNITLQSSGIITGSGTVPTGGTTGQQLTKNSNANYDVGWAAAGSGGGTPGGSNTQVQFNNASAFGGITNATSDGTTITLTSPKLVTSVLDSNANKFFDLTATASAVNYLTYANAAAGGTPTLTATGASTAIGIKLVTKGDSIFLFENNDPLRVDVQFNNTSGTSSSCQFGFAGGGSQKWAFVNDLTMTHVQDLAFYDNALPGSRIYFGSDYRVALYQPSILGWGDGVSAMTPAIDTGMKRNAAGVVEINNGTAGTYRDLYARNITLQSSGVITGSGTVPAGGTANQVLQKTSATDYAVGWVTPSAGGVTSTGTTGNIAKFTSATNIGNATAKTDYWDTTNFVQSGVTAAKGLVPAPSTTAGATAFLREDAVWAVPAGGGNVSASGSPTAGQLATWTSLTQIQGTTTLPTASFPALTGDVTTTAGALGTTIGANKVTYAMMQDVTATSRFLGRITTGAGDPEELTAANAKTILALTSTDVGLGSVTNAAQTLASIVPNTAPTSGQILIGNAGGTAYAKNSLSGSGATMSLGATGVLTISAIPESSLSITDLTTGNVTTSAHGFAPKGTSGTTQFWRQDWTLATPGGTGTVTATGGALTANSVVLGAGTTDTKVVGGIITDGAAKLTLGVSTTSVGTIDLKNLTSGTVTITPATGALGTATMTIPAGASNPVIADTGAASNFLTGISSAGAITKAQPAFTNLTGSVAATQMPALTGDVTTVAGAVATTLAAGNAGNLNSGTLLAARMPALTGDVTTTAGAVATTIGANKVTLGMQATLAADSVIGNTSASAATPAALTALPWADTGDVTRAADGKATVLANLSSAFTVQGVSSVRGDILYYSASGWAKLAIGASGTFLKAGGAGTDPSWAAAGGTPPGGSTTQVQFNDGGAFGGDADFTWDKTNNTLTIPGGTSDSRLKIGSFEVNAYAVGNSWFGDNAYFNGTAWTYRATGAAGLFYFQGTEGQFQFYASGTGGTSIPSGGAIARLKANADGTVAIGGSISTTAGTYTNSLLLVKGATAQIGIASNYTLGWSGTSGDASAAVDTAFSRNAAGTVEINNGTVGSYRDLIVRNINATAINNLTGNGFVKTSGGVGTLSVDTSTYLTANQTITLTGDVTGTGTTSFATTYANAVPTTKAGLPTAGTANQVLSKIDSTNYNTQWVTPATAGNVSNSGTPAANQLAIWTDATHVKGITGIVVDSTAVELRFTDVGLTRDAANVLGISDTLGGWGTVRAGVFNSVSGFRINNAAASRKLLVGNGTNFVASTETYAAPGTSGNVMTSDGTNWTSAAAPSEWTTLKVVSADATTSSTSLVDITGLVSATLATSSTYEFEALLMIKSSEASNGVRVGMQIDGTAPTLIAGIFLPNGTSLSGGELNTVNVAFNFSMIQTTYFCAIIRGFAITGTGTPVLRARMLKVTSGTATCKIGSILRYKLV